MNISLPEKLRKYVESRIEIGDYGTVSEYVRDLIRQDQREAARARLEALLLDGLASGDAEPMTDSDWDDIRRQVANRIVSRTAPTAPR